jgi:hypothetical protein
VIGEGHGGHAVFLGLLDQIAYADGAVKEGVLTVEMEMNEGGSFHRFIAISPKTEEMRAEIKKPIFSKHEALRQPVSCVRTVRILASGTGTGQEARGSFQLD